MVTENTLDYLRKAKLCVEKFKNEKEIDLHLIYDLEKIKSLIETKNINIFHYQHSHAVISEVYLKLILVLYRN